MASKDKYVGVFGLGSIGLRHATNLLALGYRVIGFDPSSERCRLLEEKSGRCADKETLLQEVEAVVIATPNQFHLDDLRLCVDAGVHAFVEKPLAHMLTGLDAIKEKAALKNLVVAVAMNIRLNPAMMHLKNALDQGRLGRVLWGEYTLHSYLPDWRPDQDHTKGYAADVKTGGIIFDAVHGFDLTYHLLGAYTVKGCVAQCSGSIDILSDDMADIICVHDSGITSRLHMDYITRPKEHSYHIATDKGFAYVNISQRQYRFTAPDGEVIEDIIFSDTAVNDDYTRELKEFMRAVNGEAVDYCSLEHGICVTRAAIDARKFAGLPS